MPIKPETPREVLLVAQAETRERLRRGKLSLDWEMRLVTPHPQPHEMSVRLYETGKDGSLTLRAADRRRLTPTGADTA